MPERTDAPHVPPWLPEDWDHPRPVPLPTGHHVRPIRAADTELDMIAVMSSQARLWSIYCDAWGSALTMMAEQNREDLQRHGDEMVTHESFNYALFDVDGTELIGCVCIAPAYVGHNIPWADYLAFPPPG